MKTDIHKGQVALVLVLIMTVVSVLAVSLASRSTVDTRIQQTESQSVQALLYAQTGLEQLIMNPAPSYGTPNSNSYAVTSDVGTNGLVVGLMETGSSVELNLVGSTNLTGFIVYWGPDNSGGQPAIFVSAVENTGKITDRAFDYSGQNGFTVAIDGSGGYEKTTGPILVAASVTKVRITVLGSPALIKVAPVGAGALFASQVKSIKSIGTVPIENSSVKYGLQFDESTADMVPSVFDYAIFSGGSIVQ